MKKIIFLLLYIVSCCGCEHDTEIQKFTTGTYYGEKITHYLYMDITFYDTISIKFDGIKYIYTCSNALDYGGGNYFIKNDSLEFNDEYARNALYSWAWILGGMYKYKIIDDSLFLNNMYYGNRTTCRLVKVAEL
jgi:hypothetical protein